MNIKQCFLDFMEYPLDLSKEKDFFQFNRLRDKKTSLTTPSIICYVTIDFNELQRPFVTNVVKCFMSYNPSEDIKKDISIFDSFNEIFLYQNKKHREIDRNQNIEDDQLKIFLEQIEKIKKHFELQ